ncbi:MAG: NAD-dependent epimerase/dehydratase family protein [Planctomycetota bacterium]|nr:NAD-dependent epimerase/dehydratase family protein [Planctomycetota bacterium]
MSKTLVTGGTGFLGRHLVQQLLDQGEEVCLLVRPTSDTTGLEGVEQRQGDVTDSDSMRRALEGCSRVYHLAAETRDDRSVAEYTATNVEAVESLLRLSFEMGVTRFVHTSHYFSLGRTGEPRMPPDQIAEEYWTHDPSDMHDAHEQSKYDAENEVNQCVSLGQPVIAMIPTMMYGPEMKPVTKRESLSSGNRIVAMLADHGAGQFSGLPGTGEQLWNLVYVEDVARGHRAAMDAMAEDGADWPPADWQHWHYILGGENVPARQLFSVFGKHAGVAEPRFLGGGGLLGRFMGRAKSRFLMDSHSWAYSSAMAEADFDYSARNLEEGMESTVSWMKTSGLLS